MINLSTNKAKCVRCEKFQNKIKVGNMSVIKDNIPSQPACMDHQSLQNCENLPT